MERQKIAKELHKLIHSRNNDTVRLAWLGPEDAGKIGRLDLWGVAEIKSSEKGAFEAKFMDKLNVLELLELLRAKEDAGDLDAFLEGLRVIIEEILPCHLEITYIFWYRSWGSLTEKVSTWGEAETSGKTWYELSTWK